MHCPRCQQPAKYDGGNEEIANAYYCGDCGIWRNIGGDRWTDGVEEVDE